MNLEPELSKAVRHYWATRSKQERKQGGRSGSRDYGARVAVTGGKQMDGFAKLLTGLLADCGLPEKKIFWTEKHELPGFFRPTKKWDLLVVDKGRLLACLELKSLAGPSFGNNFNNRVEEALGSALDFWTAFREGTLEGSPRPWLGYLMLLEKAEGSTSPVKVSEPHFRVREEFRERSYAQRCEIFSRRLIAERHYDAGCLILSDRKNGRLGRFVEPAEDLGFSTFAASLEAWATAHVKRMLRG